MGDRVGALFPIAPGNGGFFFAERTAQPRRRKVAKLPGGCKHGGLTGGVLGGWYGRMRESLGGFPGVGTHSIAQGPFFAALGGVGGRGAGRDDIRGGVTGALVGLGIPSYGPQRIYEAKLKNPEIFLIRHTKRK